MDTINKFTKVQNIFVEYLKYKNYSDCTINTYLSELKLFCNHFNTIEFHRINNGRIIDYITEKSTSISKQNQIISFLKLFYKNIIKCDIKLNDLQRPRKEKHLPRVIDAETLKYKLSLIQNLKHKTILSLTFSTGMRVSEVCNLKIEHIDSKRMLILIKNGKGRKDRFVPLSQNILELLRTYYKQYKPVEYLFNGQFTNQYSHGSCNEIYKKYIDKDTSFHTLRHSCFTTLLETGTDLRIIQKIAGHSNVKTTEGYTHVSTNLLNKVNLPL